jgi:adenine-specific DNA methylase
LVKLLKALPCYFGGKQKLLSAIFSQMPLPGPGWMPVLVDAFLGGGSVSLFGKAKGYQVLCNDISARSEVIGRALIENSRVRLDDMDMHRLLMQNEYSFVRANFANLFTPEDAETLDTMLGNIKELSELAVQWHPRSTRVMLWRLVVILYIVRYRKYGDFGNEGIYQPLVGRYNAQIKKSHYESVKRICTPPLRKLQHVFEAINGGIFSNGLDNRFFKMDVLDFLSQVTGDIVYFDPPYYGCDSYENKYNVLDSILAGQLVEEQPSKFNQNGALDMLREMLRAAAWSPLWIISYGGPKVTAQDLGAIVAEFRPATITELKYKYNFGNEADTDARRTEMLIVGRRG